MKLNFKEYRSKGTIHLAEITDGQLSLTPAGSTIENEVLVFSKGDYVENRAGVLLGWYKTDVDNLYTLARAPRTPTGQKKPRKKAATATPTKTE